MAVDLATATTYMLTRLNTAAWDNASQTDREKALAMAERTLADYQYRVEAERYNNALCEQALWLLQGDVRAELQQAGVTYAMIGGRTTEMYSSRRDPTIAPQAWALLRGPGGPKSGGVR